MIDTATALWIAGLTLVFGVLGWVLSGAVAVLLFVGLWWAVVGVWADYRDGG